MKDETAGAAIEEFVGLKPKVYSFLVDDNSEHKKAKVVNQEMFYSIKNVWDIQWTRFKVKIVE